MKGPFLVLLQGSSYKASVAESCRDIKDSHRKKERHEIQTPHFREVKLNSQYLLLILGRKSESELKTKSKLGS